MAQRLHGTLVSSRVDKEPGEGQTEQLGGIHRETKRKKKTLKESNGSIYCMSHDPKTKGQPPTRFIRTKSGTMTDKSVNIDEVSQFSSKTSCSNNTLKLLSDENKSTMSYKKKPIF